MKTKFKKIRRAILYNPIKKAFAVLGYNIVPRSKIEKSEIGLSLVVASYNVAPYIEQFLRSVFSQSSKFKRFEVIIVDDGSTDGTAGIVKVWKARYPNNIRYIFQENSGAAEARNTGLAIAKGAWVSFPDPDDFLAVDYFREMLKEIEAAHPRPLLAVCSNLVFYIESTDTYSDTHPLRYKFKSGKKRLLSDDLDNFIHLSGASIWIDREAIQDHMLTFDSRVKPTFEDSHFVNRVFLANPGRTVSFVPSAVYYYRKRSDKSSQVDTANMQRAWFIDKLEYGFLDLLETAQRDLGHVPRYIQRTCLYDIFWTFLYLVDHEYRADILTPQDIATFKGLLERIFSFIETEVISAFDLAGCTEEHKVALLGLYKGQRRESTAVYVRQYDPISGFVQFSYFTGEGDTLVPYVQIDGQTVAPRLISRMQTEFLGRTYFQQHFFWVPLNDNETISFSVDDVPCRIRYFGKALGEVTNWLTIRNVVEELPPDHSKLAENTQRLRAHILAMRPKYRKCWVLMDRDDRADDNAEHLYRHLMTAGRDENIWFVLSEGARDWNRLQDEGFKLLAYGSDDHIAAQFNADLLISSHADQYVLWPVEKRGLGDLVHSEFVFLQHGVTTNDVSKWLNFKPIRLFVTAMPKEAEAIADPKGPYTFTAREVLFSGFPRHDALLAKKKTAVEDLILIMPTWRRYLTVPSDVVGERRLKHAAFAESAFGRNWSEVIKSGRLRRIAQAEGLKVMLFPHPNMAMYLEDMVIPDWVETVDVRNGVSYQDFLSRARVAVTDFSSAVSEVAYLQRPVVYFQFDADEMFNGEHVYKKGFFDFERDGFGPVSKTTAEVVDHIENILSGREDPIYARRRDESFPLRDGKCCERVTAAIDRLQGPSRRSSPLYAAHGAEAEALIACDPPVSFRHLDDPSA